MNLVYNINILIFDVYGNVENCDVCDGIELKVSLFGVEVDLEVVENFYLLNKFRIFDILGGFIVFFIDIFLEGSGDVLDFVVLLCSFVFDGDGNVLNCDIMIVILVNGLDVGEVYIGEVFMNL